MKRVALLTLSLSFLMPNANGTDEDEIYRLLKHRWFDVEVIIFERLDRFEFNTVENLTHRKRPKWPRSMVEYSVPITNTNLTPDRPDAEIAFTDFDLTRPSPSCVGFPMLPEALPLHPVVLAHLQLIQDERLRLEQEALALLDVAAQAGVTETEEAQLLNQTSSMVDTPDATQADNVEQALVAAPTSDALSESSTAIPPQPPSQAERFATHLADFEQTLSEQSFIWMEAKGLEPSVRAINRQQHLRPIFHKKWRQATPDRQNPVGLRVDAPESRPRLHGTIDVSVSRYLHFNADLWYTTSDLGQEPRVFSADGTSLAATPTVRFMHIAERRRLRSRELHYIDHPKIGIIVRIDPLPIPEALLHEYALLNEAEALN
ncbi:MAG: CsiV family protein [Pseudomonadales bacterium]|nr:CsiV family protein [Pseudomonadales bacterium]